MVLFTSKHIVLPLFTAKYPLHGFSIDQKREFDKKLYERRVTVLMWYHLRIDSCRKFSGYVLYLLVILRSEKQLLVESHIHKLSGSLKLVRKSSSDALKSLCLRSLSLLVLNKLNVSLVECLALFYVYPKIGVSQEVPFSDPLVFPSWFPSPVKNRRDGVKRC